MTEALAALDAIRRPMKVSEYVALAKLGVYDDERVELLKGAGGAAPRVTSFGPSPALTH